MAQIETNQEQQRSEKTPSTEIKREAVKEVNEALCAYNKRFRHEVLTTILADVSETTDAADKLIAMESKIRAIYSGLDVRTKAMITILEELSSVEGLSLGCDFGNQIVNEIYQSPEYVTQALKEHPQDKDLAYLAESYRLARFLTEEETRPAETDEDEPEAEPEAETPEEQPENTENTTGIPFLDQMLNRTAYETSAAVYACLELVKNNEKLGEKIKAFVKSLMPNFFEQIRPETTGTEGGENLDIECDVMPSLQWLRFLDGFKAAMLSID